MTFKHINISDIIEGDSLREDLGEDLAGLSQSIEKYDIIQPILVTPLTAGKYKIVSGHRRYKAMKMRNEPTIPCIIRSDFYRKDEAFIALVENIQRKQLTPREIKTVYDKLGLSKTQFAQLIGKSQAWVSDQLKYVELYEAMLEEGIPEDVLDSFSISHLKKLFKVPHENRERVAKKAAAVKDKSRILDKAVSFERISRDSEYEEFKRYVDKINPFYAGDKGLLITFANTFVRERFLKQVWDYRRIEILQVLLPMWAREKLELIAEYLEDTGNDDVLEMIKDVLENGERHLEAFGPDLEERICPDPGMVPEVIRGV